MKKLIIVIGIVLFAAIANAQVSLHTDSLGNTYGTIDGQSVNLHSDSLGNTYGTIGGRSVRTHTDSLGNTYGSGSFSSPTPTRRPGVSNMYKPYSDDLNQQPGVRSLWD